MIFNHFYSTEISTHTTHLLIRCRCTFIILTCSFSINCQFKLFFPVKGDLTSADPALKEGANVTLLGGQAETYVRSREFEPLDANLKRMQRQQQYITSYAQKALQEMKNDLTLPLDLLNLVSDNSVTNLSAPKITYLVTKVSGSSFSADNIQSIECNIKEGETGYAEYYPDETKLFEMILKVFYKQVS